MCIASLIPVPTRHRLACCPHAGAALVLDIFSAEIYSDMESCFLKSVSTPCLSPDCQMTPSALTCQAEATGPWNELATL